MFKIKGYLVYDIILSLLFRYKVRECVLPGARNADGLPLCDGPDKEIEGCNEDACPILTEWSDWSECSVSCGGGIRFKRRECVYPKSGAVTNDCLEVLEKQESCNENPCPEYSEWSDWTQCTVSCGGGTRRKVSYSNIYINTSNLNHKNYPE